MALLKKEELQKLFPTKGSAIVFILYMAMFVAQGMLVTMSRQGGKDYAYNPTTVVLLTETLKLVLSASSVVVQGGMGALVSGVRGNLRILALYLIPSSLYCLYNNLSFVSLQYFNPTTYFMFMQIRLLLTGLIYQLLFKRQLSRMQWFSLVLLTLGCVIHAAGLGKSNSSSVEGAGAGSYWGTILQLGPGHALIVLQVLCSVFAGVYNEYIIKGDASDVDIMIQNVFMYLDSMLCNLLLLGAKNEIRTALTSASLASVTGSSLVILLIFNNAILGIVTSLFLKQLNSVVKAFASALELVFTALLSVPLLGIALTGQTVVAIFIISLAVLTYAKHPIKQQPSPQQTKQPV